MRDVFFEQPTWLSDLTGLEQLPPGMLGREEAVLLYRIVRDRFRGYGDLIDAGAFLGASSYCMAKGLEENNAIQRKSGRIHAYDLFQVWREPGGTGDMAEFLRSAYGVETAGDESTVGIYTANLGPLARHVRIHQGDVLRQSWSGRPIEVLFVDICKTREIWKHVLKTFYPSLIPGISIVMHQDWHHPWLPFLVIGQEKLMEYFELVVPKASDSAVFKLTDRIPERVLEETAAFEFTAGEELALLDRAIQRFTGANRFLRLAKAELLRQHGRTDEASELVHWTCALTGEAMTPGEASYFLAFAGGVAVRIENDALPATASDHFNEKAYLAANKDVADAVANGVFRSGHHHWFRHGRWEQRRLRPEAA